MQLALVVHFETASFHFAVQLQEASSSSSAAVCSSGVHMQVDKIVLVIAEVGRRGVPRVVEGGRLQWMLPDNIGERKSACIQNYLLLGPHLLEGYNILDDRLDNRL